jgi:putative nucleotidyltransferase with HDIG domain
MFLTRIGFNSKVVVTGDITQVDLEKGVDSGLIEIQKILKDIEEIKFIYFDKEDVVRHQLVKRIIDAYHRFNGFFANGNINYFVGIILLLLGLFFIQTLLFRMFQSNVLKEPSKLILMEIVIVLMLSIMIFIDQKASVSSYFFPSGAAAILLIILTSPFMAIMGVFAISLLAGVIGGFSLGFFFVAVAGGLAGIYSARNVRNRKDLNKCGLLILIANILSISAVGIIQDISFFDLGINIMWGVGNALVSVIIASGLLPFFESIFHITTNIRLLEIGDFNHPLLKKLMLEAPGTYHHSLMVGNLAENACEKIDANSLLARVGAYYHDIGKLKNPQYFIENQMHTSDKHKNLKPNISALILKRHVKDGLTLAEEYRLDKVIRDIIAQHHGVTLIEYFFKKVVNESKEDEVVDEKEYRYPGPMPRTKEAGVLMLADSVEAACRTLAEPTFSRISGLVRKIITNKFIDGQLNNCDITLANLEEIQKSFTNTLASIYHSRIEYPEDKEEKSVE